MEFTDFERLILRTQFEILSKLDSQNNDKYQDYIFILDNKITLLYGEISLKDTTNQTTVDESLVLEIVEMLHEIYCVKHRLLDGNDSDISNLNFSLPTSIQKTIELFVKYNQVDVIKNEDGNYYFTVSNDEGTRIDVKESIPFDNISTRIYDTMLSHYKSIKSTKKEWEWDSKDLKSFEKTYQNGLKTWSSL